MAGISIKATFAKPGARSRGRVATYTRTILRNVDPGLPPSVIMSVMANIVPMLERVPVSYQVHGVRYEVLRIESRTVGGVRVERAVFKDERVLHKSFAREMRRRHRAGRRSHVRAGRAEARRRAACSLALLAMARAARIKQTAHKYLAARAYILALSPLYLSAPAASTLAAIPSG